jgi:transcriptional regulator with XRE-family HTH domain
VYNYSEIRESRKMHLTITPVMPAKKPSQNAFGQRLVNLRQARGLTQIQLAKATGMTQRAISYYEIEAEFPPAPALITLAQTLEVTTDELLGVQPPRPAAREHPQEQRLWKRFQRMASLPTKDQRAVIRLISSLASSSHTQAEAS